jgi:outer membrane lipoprotein-sorting protein
MTVALALAAPGVPAVQAQTVDEILARHVAARGGLERIRSVRSLRMAGIATTGSGASVIVTREIKRPGRIRLEFTYQGVTGVYACDGQQGWRVSPFDGNSDPEPMPPAETQTAIEQADIDGPFVDAAAKGVTVELLGRVPVVGRDAFKLKVTSTQGLVRYHYLDVETHLLVRTEATRVRRGQTVHVETTFADYRQVGGLRFPYLIESVARGRPTSLRIIVDAVEVDPAIDDSRFTAPDMAAAK